MQADSWCHQEHWRQFAPTGAALSPEISDAVDLLIVTFVYNPLSCCLLINQKKVKESGFKVMGNMGLKYGTD